MWNMCINNAYEKDSKKHDIAGPPINYFCLFVLTFDIAMQHF